MSELHLKAVELAKHYRRLEGELLNILDQIQSRRIFVAQGYGSLFEYMVKGLLLSESTAYSLQTVIRKTKEIPELKAKVISGELSLCKAKRIAPVLTKSSAKRWIELAQTSPIREIDRQVAAMNPQVVVEKVTPKSADRSELKIGISHEFERKLQAAQDIIANQRRQSKASGDLLSASKEVVLEIALDLLLDKFSARRKDRVIGSAINRNKKLNKTLTPKTKLSILNRDDRRCVHINLKGERCSNQRFLDVHHIVPKSLGGNHEVDNLATLCTVHHKWQHRDQR